MSLDYEKSTQLDMLKRGLLLWFFLVFPFLSSFGKEPSTFLPTQGIPSFGLPETEFIHPHPNLDPHLKKGYHLLNEFQLENASIELEQALKNNQNNPNIASEAATYLGYVSIMLSHKKEARDFLEKATLLNKKNDLAYFLLANEFLVEGNKVKAHDALIKATQINDSFVPAMWMLGESYMNEGKPKETIPYFQKIVKLLPGSDYYLSRLAQAYKQANLLDEAAQTMIRLTRLEPKVVTNYAQLAEIYLSMGKTDLALDAYGESLKQDPKFLPAYLGKTRVYLLQNNLKEASDTLMQAKKIQPEDSELSQTEKQLLEKEQEAQAKRRRVLGLAFSIPFLAISLYSVYLGLHYNKRKKEILKTISAFNRGQEQIYELDELSQYITNFFAEATESKKTALFLYSRHGNQLRLSASKGLDIQSEDFSPLITGAVISQWISQNKKQISSLNELRGTLFDEAFPKLREQLAKQKIDYVIPLLERNLLLGLITLGDSLKRIPADILEPLLHVSGRALESLYLYESSVTDETTGLYNKRFFRQSLQAELRRSDRYSQPCSVLVFDIDDFKKVNDTHGHPQGDRVLKELADCVRECLREGIDTAARTGGEEFHVILPATDAEQALKAAERIRIAVRECKFSGFRHQKRITISVGIATYPIHADNETDLTKLADKALYLAKAKGKDCVCIVGDLTEEGVSKKEFKAGDQLNIIDAITSLYHTDYFMLRLKEELTRSIRYQTPCSLVLFGFEVSPQNSSFEQIRKFSPLLRDAIRTGIDIPAALDREHVAIMLPDTEKENAGKMAHRVSAMAKGFSLSAGIVSFPNDGLTEQALMTKVFWALEHAQKQGGNQCFVWEENKVES